MSSACVVYRAQYVFARQSSTTFSRAILDLLIRGHAMVGKHSTIRESDKDSRIEMGALSTNEGSLLAEK